MTEFTERYRDAEGRTERYRLLREEATRLRAGVVEEARSNDGELVDCYDRDAVADTVADLADRVDGRLVVFPANDFGLPTAYRPAGMALERQDRVRRAILDGKYDTDEDLDRIREELLAAHPQVHKALVAAFEDPDGERGGSEEREGTDESGGSEDGEGADGNGDGSHGGVRYHLPPGHEASTAFLTVREMVGLVDYVTNSAQADGLSRTY